MNLWVTPKGDKFFLQNSSVAYKEHDRMVKKSGKRNQKDHKGKETVNAGNDGSKSGNL